MSKDKCLSIFSCQIEAVVFVLVSFKTMSQHAHFENWGISLLNTPVLA